MAILRHRRRFRNRGPRHRRDRSSPQTPQHSSQVPLAPSTGTLDKLTTIVPAKDWSTARDGGPRKRVREDLRIAEETPQEA